MASRLFDIKDSDKLIQTINFVCAECEWMTTKKFIPTVQWFHAFSNSTCQMHALFVVEENMEIIGWCRVFPEECSTTINCGELGIGLLPNYRNKKIGYELMEASIAWALKKDMKRIDLTVNENNKIAFGLFEKFGFKITSKQSKMLLMSLYV